MAVPRGPLDTLFQTRAAAEALTEGLPALTLAADRLARQMMGGPHGRRRSGSGRDFWQFRPYESGDETQQIDWRQSAKRPTPHIRQTEQEASDALYFWLDQRAGMSYRSHPSLSTKKDYVTVLLLALAILLDQGEEDFTLIWSHLKIAHGQLQLNRFADALTSGATESPFSALSNRDFPRGHVLIASDFLMDEEFLEQLMERFAPLGRRGVLLHIADPAEIDLPFEGRAQFSDMSGHLSVTIGRVASVREQYQARFQEHRAKLRAIAERLGWSYLFAATNTPQSQILSELSQLIGESR